MNPPIHIIEGVECVSVPGNLAHALAKELFPSETKENRSCSLCPARPDHVPFTRHCTTCHGGNYYAPAIYAPILAMRGATFK